MESLVTTFAKEAVTSTDTRPHTGTVITYHGTEPENALIPGHTTESVGIKVTAGLFRGLVSYDPLDAQPRNAVAESIETADSQVFTIRLKFDWTFGNSNPGVHDLLAAADSALTQQQAWQKYQQAEQAILWDLPTIPIWYQSTLSAWSSRLQDMQPHAFRELNLYSLTVASSERRPS